MPAAAKTSTPTKHAGGRPKKAEAELRCKQINIRVTLQEDIELRRAAEIAGLGVAEFIRRRTLGIPVHPPAAKADARLLVELNAIGNNLNQLTRNIWSDRTSDHTPECSYVLDELQKVLRKVGDAFGQ